MMVTKVLRKNETIAQLSFDLVRALNHAATTLQRTARSRRHVFNAVHDEIVGLGMRGGLALIDETGEYLVYQVIAYPRGLRTILRGVEKLTGLRSEGFQVRVEDVDVYSEAIQTGRAIFRSESETILKQVVPQLTPDILERLLENLGKLPAIFAPLHGEDGPEGLVSIIGKELDESCLPAVEAFANHVAVAVQNADLMEKILESKDRYQDLIDGIPLGLYRTSPEGKIIEANMGLVRLLGFPDRKTFLATNARDLWSDPSQREAWKKQVESDGIVQRFRFKMRHWDGHDIWLQDTGSCVYGGNGEILYYQGSLEEISDQVAAEEARELSEARYREVSELTTDFAYAYDLTKEGDMRIDWITGAFERISGWQQEEVTARGGWETLIHPDDLHIAHRQFECLLAGESEVIEYRILTKNGDVLWMRDYAKPEWDEDQQRTVRILGAVQNITERVRREKELEAIVSVSRALRTAADRSEMLPVILEQLSDLLEAKGVAITIVEPLSGESLIELATGTWEGIVGERIEAGKGITAMILRTGEIYINNDVQGNPDARESHPRETMLQAAIAAVPLIAQDEVLGVLWIGSDKPFGGEEIRLLKATSNIAANAIRRATLHEQTEQRMLRLSVLHEIDKAIMANLSLTNILDVLLNQLKLFPEVNAASISLMDSNSLLKPTRAYGLTERAQTFISQKQDSDHPMLKAIQSRDIVEILGAPEIKRAREEVVPLRGIEFCSYLAVPLIARNNAVGVLEIFREERNLVDEEWHDFMLTLASQAAIAIHSARLIDDLKSANVELEVAYSATLEGWVHALDLRDKETEGHTLRVTEMTVELSRAMGVPEEMLVHIRRGALLHDIGKMAIPDSILLKPGPLSPDEWLIVRQHPVYAANWLAPISYLQPAIDIPRSHHERWDGSGYPEGLKGTDIPLAARIFAVVDVFDALSSDRPYRPAWPQEEILSHIRNESGKHFDPEVVEAFVRLFGNQPEQEASG